jgi:hypothetical protein
VSYSGRRLQTIRFLRRDTEWLAANLATTRVLLGDILADGGIIERETDAPGISVIRSVSSERVVGFLGRYRFSARSYDLNSAAIGGYIRAQNDTGELQRFTVAVMGRGGGPGEHGSIDLGLDEDVPLIVRSRLRNIPGDEADIKALMSKEDRAVDLPISDAELDDLTAGELGRLRNSELHGGIGDGSGLLAIYPIARRSAPTNERSRAVRENLDAADDVIGVGLVFPEAQTTEGRQTYMTADLRDLIVEEPLPEDELEEEPLEPTPPQ